MLDIKFIRDNAPAVREAIKNKNISLDLDRLLAVDDERLLVLKEVEARRSEKNEASKIIPTLQGEAKVAALTKMKEVDDSQKLVEAKLQELEGEYRSLMLRVPMVPSSVTPVGHDDSDNKEIKRVGEIPQFDFEILDHITLGQKLDIIDFERAVKIAGSRSYILKGDGARLEAALIKYAEDFITRRGYTLMNVPVLVDEFALYGTGYFPGGEEQIYTVPEDKKYLVGTSEVSLGGYYAEEVLSESQLPVKFSGYSTCFRREAGTYGKDTRGLYRVHQFNKVEQFIVCKNDDAVADEMFAELISNVEDFLQTLGLPYRILNVCTGDMGQGKYYMNDIECYMPSRASYGETHSCSNLHDFQARRLNLRYRGNDGKNHFCYTLNNTLVATPRILIPILEVYQNSDGSVTIPEVLRPYMDGQDRIVSKS